MKFCLLSTFLPVTSQSLPSFPSFCCRLLTFLPFFYSLPPSFPPALSFLSLPSPSLPGTLPYDIKIVIAGNHELTFDQEFMADLIKQDFYYFPSASKLKPENYENVQSLLTNCIYLQDSEVTVRGFRIYGSPWWVTPTSALHTSKKKYLDEVSCSFPFYVKFKHSYDHFYKRFFFKVGWPQVHLFFECEEHHFRSIEYI